LRVTSHPTEGDKLISLRQIDYFIGSYSHDKSATPERLKPVTQRRFNRICDTIDINLMADHPTTFDDHDPLAHDILRVLEEFIDEIGARECTAHFDKVVDGKYLLKGKHLIQEPERFIEDHLVFPILRRALGHSLRPRPKQYAPKWPRSGVPDFCVTSVPIDTAKQNDLRLFGEVKPPKKIENARNDMAKYLDSDLDIHAIVMLTDGFKWELWVRPKGTSVAELGAPNAEADLRESLRTVRTRNMRTVSYRPYEVRSKIENQPFVDFTQSAILDTIESEFGVSITTD
jgi:hypothetical protein